VEDRVCANCGGLVAATDKACRHCGVSFDAVIRPNGSFLHEFLRVALGIWALVLPAVCLWAALTAPKGWSDKMAERGRPEVHLAQRT
jgi:hypothetical protein